MKSIILIFISEYDIYRYNKVDIKLQLGLLQPLYISHYKWQDITMGFIVRLPLSIKYDSILVVIDRLVKYTYFVPIHAAYKVPHIIDIYLQTTIYFQGFSSIIIYNRDPKFTSSLW